MSADPICPECEQGKHGNCTEWAINDTDDVVPCGCPTCNPVPY